MFPIPISLHLSQGILPASDLLWPSDFQLETSDPIVMMNTTSISFLSQLRWAPNKRDLPPGSVSTLPPAPAPTGVSSESNRGRQDSLALLASPLLLGPTVSVKGSKARHTPWGMGSA